MNNFNRIGTVIAAGIIFSTTTPRMAIADATHDTVAQVTRKRLRCRLRSDALLHEAQRSPLDAQSDVNRVQVAAQMQAHDLLVICQQAAGLPDDALSDLIERWMRAKLAQDDTISARRARFQARTIDALLALKAIHLGS